MLSSPFALGAATLLLGAMSMAGCSSSEPELGVIPAELVRAQSCSDLLTLLKTDARVRMNRYFDLQIAALERVNDRIFDNAIASGGDAEFAGSGGATAAPAAPPEHSETNTQVAGVDEADIVKTDGYNIQVLHGRSLTTLKSWPVSELGMQSSFGIEGDPIEMFVADGKAVVYSLVDGTTIYEALGKPLPARDDPYYGEYDAGWGYYNSLPVTKITVLDVSGTAPVVLSEQYEEGTYVSSRRDGKHVRTVLTGGAHEGVVKYWPSHAALDYSEGLGGWIDAYEDLRAENEIAIDLATLDDFLPGRFVKTAGKYEEVAPSCTDALVPTAGSTDSGLTTVHAFDLGDLARPARESLVFGATQTVYANQEKLVLAGASWGTSMGLFWGVDVPSEPVSLYGTHLHVFDLTTDPSAPRYVDSATALGTLTDQFAIDERGGVLRVATTETKASSQVWTTTNGVSTFADGSNEVTSLGALRGLAPGETIYSTRFLGDRAYMVTFRQMDPLFAIDLSNPSSPALLGELEIPGFSEYMHPLEDDLHLLTIGFDGTAAGDNGGLALQIFDVTDPTHPKLTHKNVFSSAWSGWSEALYNHKAFTLYRDMLAIPYEGYDDSSGQYGSALKLFRVSTKDGIEELGTIDHSSYLNQNSDYCYYGRGVRRGVFIEDFVYSVSASAVVASSVDDVATPVAVVNLPDIDSSYCEYGY